MALRISISFCLEVPGPCRNLHAKELEAITHCCTAGLCFNMGSMSSMAGCVIDCNYEHDQTCQTSCGTNIQSSMALC